MSTATPNKPAVIYPDSDGEPMSDNTLQFQWIVTIQGGLDAVFRDNQNVFVAGDLLWYPVEGDNTIRAAPDAMVVFGRRKGYRGSYRQWEEGGIAPQVVFEVLSPGNRAGEISRKLAFYDRYGVEEFYIYDPDRPNFEGWHRTPRGFEKIEDASHWTSPRLGVRFELTAGEFRILGPDGRPFATYLELAAEREAAERQAEEYRERADRLAAKLRELGIDPDA